MTVASVNEAPINLWAGTNTAVAITNAGFEAYSLSDAGFNSIGGYGWTFSSGNAGYYNPRADQMASEASEGTNSTYVNSTASLSQTLSETLAANTTYQLTVDVGNRQDIAGYSSVGTISLYAGGTLIGTAAVGTPPEGGWSTVKLEVDSATLGNPLLIGEQLTITLANGSGTQINFDNVLLDKIANPTIAENSSNSTVITTITGVDPDAGQSASLTYSLTDNAGGRFAINSSTGQVTVADSSLLNFEAGTSHSITVRATDTNNHTYDEQLAIHVSDVAENLTLTSGNDTFTDTSVTELSIDGGAGDDNISGSSNNDTITGGTGNDTIDGGAGTDDVAVFSGNWNDYTISQGSDAGGSFFQLIDRRGGSPDGTDKVYNTEQFQFADRTITASVASDLLNDAPTGSSVASATAPVNYVVNGSFEQFTSTHISAVSTGQSYVATPLGWTVSGAGTIRIADSGYSGMNGTNGGFFGGLSENSSGANVALSQSIAGLNVGQTYNLTFDRRLFGNAGAASEAVLQVWWNGTQVGSYDSSSQTSFTSSSLSLTAGSGPIALSSVRSAVPTLAGRPRSTTYVSQPPRPKCRLPKTLRTARSSGNWRASIQTPVKRLPTL